MRVGVYAGTFDPVTHGHRSVIERGAALFDRLYVLVASNPSKQPLLSVEERLGFLADLARAWPHVSAASTSGFVVDFARAHGARYLIRGVRSSTDVEAEIQLAHLNHELAPDIQTVFVPAHPKLSEVSSSRLKELIERGEDASAFCSPEVLSCLRQKLAGAVSNAGGFAHG